MDSMNLPTFDLEPGDPVLVIPERNDPFTEFEGIIVGAPEWDGAVSQWLYSVLDQEDNVFQVYPRQIEVL